MYQQVNIKHLQLEQQQQIVQQEHLKLNITVIIIHLILVQHVPKEVIVQPKQVLVLLVKEKQQVEQEKQVVIQIAQMQPEYQDGQQHHGVITL